MYVFKDKAYQENIYMYTFPNIKTSEYAGYETFYDELKDLPLYFIKEPNNGTAVIFDRVHSVYFTRKNQAEMSKLKDKKEFPDNKVISHDTKVPTNFL